MKHEWLKSFNEMHREWLETVSASFLCKGKRHETLDGYLKYLPVEAFPLDLLGILIYARMCHQHVAVFVGEHYWTTHVDDDFQKCRVFLAYRGDLVFDDSRMMTGPEYALVREDVMRFRRHLERDSAKIYAEEKAAAEHEGRQMDKRKIRNQIESDSDTDLEQILDNTPEDNHVQNKDTDIMQNQSVEENETSNNMQKKNVETDIMQNQSVEENKTSNDLHNKKVETDIMQNQSDVEDQSVEENETSNNMQKKNVETDIMQNQSVEENETSNDLHNKKVETDIMQNQSDAENQSVEQNDKDIMQNQSDAENQSVESDKDIMQNQSDVDNQSVETDDNANNAAYLKQIENEQ